jgi:hypothetical protein
VPASHSARFAVFAIGSPHRGISSIIATAETHFSAFGHGDANWHRSCFLPLVQPQTREIAMNASESPTNTPNAVEPIAASSKFVLGSFLAFFLVISVIVVGDFIVAFFR